ncbi:MAG: hypothetical protein OEM15_16660 [Myxococcales bacterium]|nr:hypothetical protein [Myxococcales bacterium]
MAGTRPTAPRSLVIRRACATLGLLALILQGSSGGHMLLVEHTKCAEHGELVHDAHGHPANLANDPGPSLLGTSNAQTEASHDHCSLATERRDAVTSIVGASVTGMLTIIAPDDVEIEVTPSDSAPRFRLAPKNSPPA